jgi:hypothetical protein
MRISHLTTAVIAAALSLPTLAADQYIFGYSDFNASNKLVVNGSTDAGLLDSGWYSDNGNHNPSNRNYIVGICTTCTDSGEYRNWFVFDISNLSGTVTSASFTLYSYSVTLTAGNYYLNDVSTSISSLTGGTGGLAAFNDLGGGTNYGFRFYQDTESNTFHSIALNGGALAGLNAAIANGDRSWAIGGAFAPGDVPIPPPMVPEPETYLLMALGLAVVAKVARRKA